jgi:uncharacterized protein YabE (DUF348 family)
MKRIRFLILILFWLTFLGYAIPTNAGGENTKNVTLFNNGLEFEISTNAQTVGDFLDEQKITTDSDDLLLPANDAKLNSGMNIIIESGRKISISADGRKINAASQMKNVQDILFENNISLGEDDITTPSRLSSVADNTQIKVIRVKIEQQTVHKDISFEIQSTEDDKLSWRTKKIQQKGAKGTREIIYKVVSYDGKEISRKELSESVIKDPVDEISVQGTYMKLGKEKRGQGTWYAFKGGLFAASTTIGRGGYAKVTNMDNGKTVVVQINDYGPQGKGRIIDLDKVAFEEIASLGAGVINVKVEQVLN